MIPWIRAGQPFPPLHSALREPSGLLAASTELRADHLLEAYKNGIFPWYSPGEPVLWWSPDPRMTLTTAELKIPRSLAKVRRHRAWRITFDQAFSQVIQHCANTPRPGQNGTWITSEVIAAYTELHRQGYAHSVETWYDHQLVGGLYGIAIGKMFYGESMFAHQADASKLAFVTLVEHLHQAGFKMIDCQVYTDHLARFGAYEIPREAFITHLRHAITEPAPAADFWRSEFSHESPTA